MLIFFEREILGIRRRDSVLHSKRCVLTNTVGLNGQTYRDKRSRKNDNRPKEEKKKQKKSKTVSFRIKSHAK